MGISGNFGNSNKACVEYTQLVFQAHSAGEQEVIIIIKFMAESMMACTAHIRHATKAFITPTVS